MTVELVTEALACVYSGATDTEGQALIDALADRGLEVATSEEDVDARG